ncbi:MAG: protein-disulfide reductase DsbD domain-containing protein [Planctomycetota bacterium]
MAESPAIAPGQTILVGLRFELADKWHIYWHGRNDTGFAPTVEWTLPEGVTIGPMLWPAPERYISPGAILDHVYEGEPTILMPVTLAEGAASPGDTLTIRGHADWLVCKQICLPADQKIDLSLRVESAPPSTAIDASTPIGGALAGLPTPVGPQGVEGLSIRHQRDATSIRADGASRVTFYPLEDSTSLLNAIGDASAERDWLQLRLLPPGEDLGRGDRRLVGVVEIERRVGGQTNTERYLVDHGEDGYRQPPNAKELRDAIARLHTPDRTAASRGS